jgi:hypothetical protein
MTPIISRFDIHTPPPPRPIIYGEPGATASFKELTPDSSPTLSTDSGSVSPFQLSPRGISPTISPHAQAAASASSSMSTTASVVEAVATETLFQIHPRFPNSVRLPSFVLSPTILGLLQNNPSSSSAASTEPFHTLKNIAPLALSHANAHFTPSSVGFSGHSTSLSDADSAVEELPMLDLPRSEGEDVEESLPTKEEIEMHAHHETAERLGEQLRKIGLSI